MESVCRQVSFIQGTSRGPTDRSVGARILVVS